MIKDIRFAREWDGRVRLRCEFIAVVPAVRCLSMREETESGSYDVMVSLNQNDSPVHMRIENIAAIDEVFEKAAKQAVSEEAVPLDLDFETGAHIKSFCEAEAYDVVDVWRGGS